MCILKHKVGRYVLYTCDRIKANGHWFLLVGKRSWIVEPFKIITSIYSGLCQMILGRSRTLSHNVTRTMTLRRVPSWNESSEPFRDTNSGPLQLGPLATLPALLRCFAAFWAVDQKLTNEKKAACQKAFAISLCACVSVETHVQKSSTALAEQRRRPGVRLSSQMSTGQ